MTNIEASRAALVARILEGDARTPQAQRRAAFDDSGLPEPLRVLVDKVAHRAPAVRDEDFAAARTSGLSEDQLFELVVCAAVGQASRQYDAARAALDAATQEE
jgi:alkylhydroperoxidase family enzyme